MVFFNYATMQMAAKIVYYGPGLCGKTTNLHHIYGRTAPGSRGEMVSLETETDRTLFFDLLPLDVGVIGGFKTRVQLYTVPGQVFYNTTRKLVLKGVDGIVFVADSQRAMKEANIESYQNLRSNLAEIGVKLEELPLVLQYNKRDLANILTLDELDETLEPRALVRELRGVRGSGTGRLRDAQGHLAPDAAVAQEADARRGPPGRAADGGRDRGREDTADSSSGARSAGDSRDSPGALPGVADTRAGSPGRDGNDLLRSGARGAGRAVGGGQPLRVRRRFRRDRPGIRGRLEFPRFPAPGDDRAPKSPRSPTSPSRRRPSPTRSLSRTSSTCASGRTSTSSRSSRSSARTRPPRPWPPTAEPGARLPAISIDDLLASSLNHRKEISRIFEMQVPRSELSGGHQIRVGLQIEDREQNPVGEEKSFAIELHTRPDLEKLLLSLKFHIFAK